MSRLALKPLKTRVIRSGAEYMTLHADGTISRANWPVSGKWRVTGAVERNNFGAAVRRYTLDDILRDPRAIAWRCKNGAQRTFLCDLDHGTPREWRSPAHDVY